jgi:hypothetical protein
MNEAVRDGQIESTNVSEVDFLLFREQIILGMVREVVVDHSRRAGEVDVGVGWVIVPFAIGALSPEDIDSSQLILKRPERS